MPHRAVVATIAACDVYLARSNPAFEGGPPSAAAQREP